LPRFTAPPLDSACPLGGLDSLRGADLRKVIRSHTICEGNKYNRTIVTRYMIWNVIDEELQRLDERGAFFW
jgi:hypothetical protein